MKLLRCSNCKDVFQVSYQYKTCECGKCAAFHVTRESLVYSGKYARFISLDNKSVEEGFEKVLLDGKGFPLNASVIPYYCASTIKVKDAHLYYSEKILPYYYYLDKIWASRIEEIRIKNPFLRLIYNVFKKYIFISLEE